MDHKQTVKLDNYKAQHNSIVSNISSKNKELEAVLGEVLKATTSLNFILGEVGKAGKSLETIRLQSSEIEEKQRRTDQILNDKAAGLKRISQELDLEKQIIAGKKTERELLEDSYIEDGQRKVRELEDKSLTLTNRISSESEEIKAIAKTKETLVKEIGDLRKKRNNQEIVLKQEIEELGTIKQTKQKQIDAMDKEILDLNKKVAIAVEKMRMPNRLLAERETRVKEQEHNLDILIVRWRKFHQELFPGQTMKL